MHLAQANRSVLFLHLSFWHVWTVFFLVEGERVPSEIQRAESQSKASV